MFLGTSPFAQRKQSRKDAQRLKYEGQLVVDEFEPKTFRSTRNSRINFLRVNDRETVLEEIADSRDAVGADDSGHRNDQLEIDTDAIGISRPVEPEASQKPTAFSHVKLSYYGDEDDDPHDALQQVKFAKPKVMFKRRKVTRNIAGKDTNPVHSIEVDPIKFTQPALNRIPLKLPQAPEGGTRPRLVHFRRPKVTSLKQEDYQLLLTNFDFVTLPQGTDRTEFYLYLQDQVHGGTTPAPEYSSVCSLLINNFHNSRFTDDTATTTTITTTTDRSRPRRTERPLDIPQWFLNRLDK